MAVIYHSRPATPEDAETITRQRHAMFKEIGQGTDAQLAETDVTFTPWVHEQLTDGTYVGWFMVTEDGAIAAGAGLWLMHWPPGPLETYGRRAYVLNVYTEPEHRGQGLAKKLMAIILQYCADNRYTFISLHASRFGRPMYEALGFEPTNEMRLIRR